jgi:hypothetical protein
VPIIKPAQKHKYNTKTAQIHKANSKQQKGNNIAGKEIIKEITTWELVAEMVK